MADLLSTSTTVGTIWTCPRCGLEHRRRFVSVDALNDARAEIDRLRDALRRITLDPSEHYQGNDWDSGYAQGWDEAATIATEALDLRNSKQPNEVTEAKAGTA